ncbi:PDR/VanB family oxidoreductase [Klebsiella sp. BIGb0407]|uniref:PDR/VanB family oxidoreductase n=1 Tax=Klebsiella sp. BIGb0407 TaxID=2940603 RepID=UPI0021683DD0|nr:PDR/VanB family oxidoreductase [Klebsiella sp. BIGb0407]
MSNMLNVIVDGMWRQGDNNLAIRLVPDRDESLPAWQPGAHIDVHLPGGIIRQYSLTGNPHQMTSYLICIARETHSRGGSRYIHEALRPGQRLSVSSPRNLFVLQPAAQVTLLAAGIGITPLYAMALQLAAEKIPFVLHYSVKNRENGAFIAEVMQNLPEGSVIIHSSSEGKSPRHTLNKMLGDVHAGHHIYLCGPEGFMSAGRQAAVDKGWSEAQIHSEAFQAQPVTAKAGEDHTFTVTLSSSGEKWSIPSDKTIARVLQENGVDVPLSCEMGICGACLTPVIAGLVDHRDTVQSETEKCADAQYIALCCSRSHSDNLTIDL